MCVLVCFLVVHHIWTVIAPDIDVLYGHHDDEIKVLELWNLRNLFCGEWDSHQAYRNDFIDNVDLDCIERLTVRIFKNADDQLILEYWNITSRKLEDHLRRKPDRATSDRWGDNPKVPLPTDQYLVNEGNYEFRWLNQNGDRIFAALYYESSADKFPKFYYSEVKEGAEHTEPDKDNHPGMEDCHDIRVSFTVQSIDKCNASNVNHSIHLAKCPDFKPPTVTSTETTYAEDIGSNVTLNCKHASNDPVTKVEWLFQNTLDNSYRVKNVRNTNLAKYGGSTVASPSLIIHNIMPDDIGKYKCLASTDYASEPGSGPPIDVGLHEAAPVFKESIIHYEFGVGGNIQLPCSYVAYPAVTFVKWSTDSECGLKDDMIGPILNPDLIIYNATTCNSGNYQCCVKNSKVLAISPVCGNNILVGYRPIVIVIREPIVAKYQTRHTIECSVEAFPNITSVEWNITTEAGTKIFSSDENNLGKYFGSSVTSPSLDILMADFTDTGRYICTAENIFGKSSSTVVYIQVYGISLTVSSTYYTVVYGNDVELKCNITGRPDITKVTWSMQKGTGEHQINMTNILKYNGSMLSDHSLTIYNVIFEDDGIYFCGAGNSYENRTSQEITLTVTSDQTLTTTTAQNPGTTSTSTTSTSIQNPETTSPTTTSTSTQNPGTTSPSTTSTTTQNPGTTSASTTSTSTQNPGTASASTTSTTTQNPGTVSASTTLTTPPTTTKPEEISCQCPCSSLGIGARQDLSNYTIDELLEMLAPQLAKMEKELSVDKSNLSATINKRISAKDERKSSQSIGILGIVFIVSVILGVVIIDLMSIVKFMKPKLKKRKN